MHFKIRKRFRSTVYRIKYIYKFTQKYLSTKVRFESSTEISLIYLDLFSFFKLTYNLNLTSQLDDNVKIMFF